jgi:hypothetical protein
LLRSTDYNKEAILYQGAFLFNHFGSLLDFIDVRGIYLPDKWDETELGSHAYYQELALQVLDLGELR